MTKNTPFIILALIAILFSSCKDRLRKDEIKAEDDLNNYIKELSNQGLDVQKDRTGIYYVVYKDSGNTTLIDTNNLIEFNGSIALLDGEIIHTTSKEIAQENEIYDSLAIYGTQRLVVGYYPIEGINLGLPLFSKGDSVQIIIPYMLAYGTYGTAKIPPYSNLAFFCKIENIIANPHEHERDLINDYIANDSLSINVWDTTEYGVYHITIEDGAGEAVEKSDTLNINFECYYLDGRKINIIDTTTLILFGNDFNNILHPYGFHNGMALMNYGEKAKLIIPYYSAFGATIMADFRPYSSLVYIVEIAEKTN